MHIHRHYISFADAAEFAKRRPADLLHYAVQGKLTLLVGVPDAVTIRVYDETTNSDIEPFLVTPQFLALSQSQCLILEVNGHTVQSNFPDGYCVQASGELNRVSPTYGYPSISNRWSFWQTFLNDTVHSIELTPDRLFVLHSDLEKTMEPGAGPMIGERNAPANQLDDNTSTSKPVRATEFRFRRNSFDERVDVEIPSDTRQYNSEQTVEPDATLSVGPNTIIKGDSSLNSTEDTLKPTVVSAKVPQDSTVDAKKEPKQPKATKAKLIPLHAETKVEESTVSSDIVRDGSVTILRLKQVLQRTGLSRSTIYDKMNRSSPRFDPTFPSSVSLGTGSVGWIESDVNSWLDSRIKH